MGNQKILDKLFNLWKHKVVFHGITFYQRIVPSTVQEDGRRYALLKSRELRKKLKDKESEEYKAYLADFLSEDPDTIKTLIVNAALTEAAKSYVRDNPKMPVPEPGPSLEEQEEYENALEERDKVYRENLTKYLEEFRDTYEKTIEKWGHERMLSELTRIQIDRLCEEAFIREFENYIVASSLFEDEAMKNRVFSVEDFNLLPDDARQFFIDSYNSINVTDEEIKN